MIRCRNRAQTILVAILCLTTVQVGALVVPEDGGGVAGKSFRHPDLNISEDFQPASKLPPQASERALQDLEALGAPASNARIDRRTNRFAALTPSQPLIPGPGQGNGLKWKSAADAPQSRGEIERAARQAFAAYLQGRAAQLRIDPAQVRIEKVTAADDTIVQIYAPRSVGGVPVRGSYMNAVLNRGNLVLMGTHLWGDVDVDTTPTVSAGKATTTVASYADPFPMSGKWGKTELVIVPMANGRDVGQVALGQGLTHRLAWSVKASFAGDHGSYEALVDAHTGELLSFEDTNHYAEVRGGVLPVSNDGVAPDGVEQPGWPMPYDIIATASGNVTSDSGGNFTPSGNGTSTLSGQYIRMNDNCGAINLVSAGDIDFGFSAGTDCVNPGFGGAGNTHASRTGFHELNRIKEMARGQLPANGWLQNQLTSNMNINSTCNAFWNGSTVNFYRSGGGCSNTGELAGVFDHEWGHGMDANDATPGVSNPGEGIADIYTALRLNNSCIGRNFRPGVQCGGYGDPCTNCTGVRDIDWAMHVAGTPHDVTWAIATCGTSVHCRGYVYSESVWDLWHRDLSVAPYNMDNNTALELTTRLTYIGAGGVGTWFANTPPFGGCSATGGYLNYLAADDDNGNINDGTPHMGAIFDAFNRHEAACDTPAVVDSGCAGTPTSAPTLSATPTDKSASLSWTAVTGATSYQVFRTDGVFACDFGKIKIGETAGTNFNDSGLQNGRDYSYIVVPIGAGPTCMGPASNCATVTPASGPNLDIDAGSAVLTLLSGDGDGFLDNCENARLTFDVRNSGLGTLNNVAIVSVTPTSHPSTMVTSIGPVVPSTLGEGATGNGSFDFNAQGLSFNDTLIFQVEVTADELVANKLGDLVVSSTESDFVTYASRTFSFETDLESWSVAQGTWNRSSAIGGGGGTSWAVASSNGLHNQCDRIRSPIFRLTSTSTLSLDNNFDIEPFSASTWYDRANIGIIDGGGARSLITPDSGRLYNADSNGPGNYSGCNDPEEGWAGLAASWATSGWSAGALGSAGLAGQPIQLEVIYATDPALANRGFSFDQVTLTDVEFQEADGQSDVCAVCTVDADCDDGMFCNGAETCNVGTGACEPGTPVDCGDGVGCTDDTCNEATDSCENVANDANCDNGLFCDGAETCDALLDCQAGTAPNCDDGVGCTDDACNEATDQCDNVANDANCDDGLYCNGAETCDSVLDCLAGSDPCFGAACDEVNDVCAECSVDAECNDGLFCNGVETCDGFSCLPGSDPCAGAPCDEVNDTCGVCAVKGESCNVDADCCDNKCRGKAGAMTCK